MVKAPVETEIITTPTAEIASAPRSRTRKTSARPASVSNCEDTATGKARAKTGRTSEWLNRDEEAGVV